MADVDQRIDMFVKVNELGDGVVDRLSALDPEQLEKAMNLGTPCNRRSL